jgi:acyl-CoA thioesterase
VAQPFNPTDPADRAMQIAQRMIAQEGTGAAWGIELEAADAGYARVGMRLTPAMLNGFGIAHGGMIFALADSAFAYACNSRNVKTVAQSGSIVFLDAARAGERLVAEARETALRGRTGAYVITVTGEDGRVIAEMQGLSRAVGGPTLEDI